MRETLRDQLAKSKAKDALIKSLDDKIKFLRVSYKENQDKIKEAELRTANAANFEDLQKHDSDLTAEISRFRARLEHDEQFQATVKNGLCPILSQKCLNLKPHETLESFLGSQFVELRTNIEMLSIEKRELADKLKFAREAEKFAAALEPLRSRESEIKAEGTRLRIEKETLENETGDFSQFQKDLADAEEKLKILDNPKAKIKLLEIEAKRETEIREKLREIDKNLERLENDKRITVEKLESYKDLDANWLEFSEVRDATADAHREFLTNETLAKSLPERETEFAAAQSEIANLIENLTAAETEFSNANQNYDREKHQTERVYLTEARTKQTETGANLENTKKRQAQLAAELEKLTEIRKQMQAEFYEKERLEKVAETTAFIRDTLKEAAPRVAQKLRSSRFARSKSDVPRNFRQRRTNIALDGRLRHFARRKRTRTPVHQLERRRTNGGGVVGQTRLIKTAFRHSPRVFRRTDNEYGRVAPRKISRTNFAHHRKTDIRSIIYNFAR